LPALPAQDARRGKRALTQDPSAFAEEYLSRLVASRRLVSTVIAGPAPGHRAVRWDRSCSVLRIVQIVHDTKKRCGRPITRQMPTRQAHSSLPMSCLRLRSSFSSVSSFCRRHALGSSLGGLALLAIGVACGTPGGIEDTSFPGVADLRYTGVPGRNGTGGALSRGGNTGRAGTSGVGAGGANGGGGRGGAAGGGSQQNLPPGCTEDPIALMAKPFQQGGCQDPEFGGCHGADPENEESPDLLSPGVLERLLGVAAECDDVPGLVLIAPGRGLQGSFMANKLTPDFVCGEADSGQMPTFPADPNSAVARATRTCLEAWITQVAGGN
jgi:hypothetical protein